MFGMIPRPAGDPDLVGTAAVFACAAVATLGLAPMPRAMCSGVKSDHPVDAMSGHPSVTHDSLMRVGLPQSSRTDGDARAWPVAALVDEMPAMYVEWREHDDTVADAYGCCCAAPPRRVDCALRRVPRDPRPGAGHRERLREHDQRPAGPDRLTAGGAASSGRQPDRAGT